MHEVETGGVSQETLTRRFPRLHFYGCSAGGSPRRPLPEGSLDHIRHWALHLPPGPTWHSSNHLAKSCPALLAESMRTLPMDSANLIRRHSERNEKRMRLQPFAAYAEPTPNNQYRLTAYAETNSRQPTISATSQKLLDVSAWMPTVGIYAECYALSPEEPQHYNQHTSEAPAYKNTCVCRLCGSSSNTYTFPQKHPHSSGTRCPGALRSKCCLLSPL